MKKSEGISFTAWLSEVVKTGKYKFTILSKMYEDDIRADEVKNKVGGKDSKNE